MKQIIEKTKTGKQTYEISSYLTSERVISLFGEVNDELVNELIQQIIALNIESTDEITLLINSGGGSINAGLALCDVMKISKAPIRTIAISMAASMAAVIFSSGAKGKREILPSARVMIHDPRVSGNMGVVTVKDAVELGKNLNKTKNQLNIIIANNTGKSLKQINKDTSYDHYFSADEAIKYGLCDKIVENF